MKTTFKKIKSFSPCSSGWEKLIGYYNPESEDKEISIKEIIKSNGIKDTVWALRCIQDKNELNKVYLFCADVAESGLNIFKKKYPKDDRPREAIEAIRLFIGGGINRTELKAAADAAADAAVAAADAAYAAAYAADANAADAAAAAAYAAAYAAAAAVADAATDAAYAAVAAAAADAAYAAVAAARKNKWIEIEKLLLKNIN